MLEVTKTLATACCGLFFGAALYISLVQHPAMLEAGSDFAARFFGPMYGRAAVMQASLALIGCVAAMTAWLKGAGPWWLAAALLLGSPVPFTLVVMKPVNDALLQPSGLSAVEINALLIRWGYFHWARTVASGFAFISCLAGFRARVASHRLST